MQVLQFWGQPNLYQMSQEQRSVYVYLFWTESDILVDANQRDSLQSQDSPVTFLPFLKCELLKTQWEGEISKKGKLFLYIIK